MKVIEIETIDKKIYGAFDTGRVLDSFDLYHYILNHKLNKNEYVSIHESEISSLKYVNALEIIINPNTVKEHKDIYPDMYTSAFNILWKLGKELKNDGSKVCNSRRN